MCYLPVGTSRTGKIFCREKYFIINFLNLLEQYYMYINNSHNYHKINAYLSTKSCDLKIITAKCPLF